jgi:hypothetical protein
VTLDERFLRCSFGGVYGNNGLGGHFYPPYMVAYGKHGTICAVWKISKVIRSQPQINKFIE